MCISVAVCEALCMSLHVAWRLAHMDVFGACGTLCAPTFTCVCHSFVISILAISNDEYHSD